MNEKQAVKIAKEIYELHIGFNTQVKKFAGVTCRQALALANMQASINVKSLQLARAVLDVTPDHLLRKAS